ncbi:MAG TPA: hypothetical protein VFE23_20295 [Usitatibacter sp.]|jgi:hypothetical protein|nr:hypothetical protein [Usitatibacter sp.]
MRASSLRSYVLFLILAASGSAHATFHLWSIVQLYSNADGTIQFVELKSFAAGEEFLAGHTIVSTHGSATQKYTFPNSLPGDTAMTTGDSGGYYGGGGDTTYRSMLIATEGFAALGIVTPDYVVPNGFLSVNGGALNYGEGADTLTYPALPTDGRLAWNRSGSTGVNAPLNFNGMSGTVTVTAALPGTLSGLWWNPGESGWGIDFTQRRDIVFAAWYTYDANGNPKWYVASNCAMPSAGVTSGTCHGSLYEVNGPTFFGAAFNPAAVNVVTAGSIAVTFMDTNNASFTYTVGSQTRTVSIVRQAIAGGSIPGVDYTDLWWNPNESGWGMAVAQQGSVMFLAWYVYDSSGKPVWYVASNCAVSSAGCSGPLYRTVGPAFGATFDSSRVQVTPAGTVSLTFADPNNGTLTYTVNGVTASKAVTRQMF